MINPIGGSQDPVRDGACTPKWLADLLPTYDVDPCSNPRSHIRARERVMLERRQDGLRISAGSAMTVFCNPPYSRGQVIQWVHRYQNTDFTFLLRWDPSTKWFATLWPLCWGAWFPNLRMNFEPPPGVKFSSNPFPHALYFAEKPVEAYNGLAGMGYFVKRSL